MNTTPPSADPDESDVSHQPIRALLPDCATWQACGVDPSRYHPEVMRHVETCSSCRQEFDELVALLLIFEEPVPVLNLALRPNLAFLKPSSPSPPEPDGSWIDKLGRWLVPFSQPFLAAFAPPVQHGMARGSRGPFKRHRLRDLPSGSTLTLEIHEERDGDTATLLVKIDRPDQDPFDQSGNRVILHSAAQQWSDVTDDTGSVAFPDLPRSLLPALKVEILPPES